MYVLTAVVVFFAGVTLLNLVLTVGLVRRMRTTGGGHEHPEGVTQRGLQPGESAPALGLEDVTGERGTLLAFFSTDCSACPRHLPRFLEAVRGYRGSVAAVLSGRAEKYEFYESELADGVRLAYERGETTMGSGPLISAFGIKSWPAFFLLDPDGKVTAVGLDALAQAGKVLV